MLLQLFSQRQSKPEQSANAFDYGLLLPNVTQEVLAEAMFYKRRNQ